MLKIKIGEKEIEYLEAIETEEYYNGASRRTLTVTCTADAISLDELNALLCEENLASIKMKNTEENAENIYDGYVLKLNCGINAVLTQTETPETAAAHEDRIVFKLGKRTYIEEQLHKLGL